MAQIRWAASETDDEKLLHVNNNFYDLETPHSL